MLNGPVIDCVWSVDRAHQLFNGLYVTLDLVRHILAVKIGCLNVSVGDRLSGIVEVSDQVGDVRNSVSLMQFSRSVRLFPMPPRRLYSNMEGSSLDGRFETIEPLERKVVDIMCVQSRRPDPVQVSLGQAKLFPGGRHFYP